MNKSVFCIAQTNDQVEHIISQLKAAGFDNNDISVLLPDKTSEHDDPVEQIELIVDRCDFECAAAHGLPHFLRLIFEAHTSVMV